MNDDDVETFEKDLDEEGAPDLSEDLNRIAEAFGVFTELESVDVDELAAMAGEYQPLYDFFEAARELLGLDEKDPESAVELMRSAFFEAADLVGVPDEDDATLPAIVAAAQVLVANGAAVATAIGAIETAHEVAGTDLPQVGGPEATILEQLDLALEALKGMGQPAEQDSAGSLCSELAPLCSEHPGTDSSGEFGAAPVQLRPRADWSEDDGTVLWYALPVQEPPYVGTPLDSDWPFDTASDSRWVAWYPLPVVGKGSEPAEAPPVEEVTNAQIVDLMEALKASLKSAERRRAR